MTSPLPPGTPLRDGRYVVVGALGEGSQGATYEAVDKVGGRAVAIKRFDVRGARAWKDVELAEREARVLSGLRHPKLPAYVEHFEENGELYLVMEKIEGTPLSTLRKRGPIDEAEVIRLLADADEVLRYLHGLAPPVIHRDLKPGNVLRRPDGSFAFVDFGAVRDRMRPEGGSTVVGTFGYMAPEQFQGRASPGSDVYAIGATALALLTGVEPESLPHKGLAIDVQAALAGRSNRRLRELLERMLEPDPDRRPQAIGPLLEALRAPRPSSAPASQDQNDRGPASRARRGGVDWARIADEGAKLGRQIEEEVRRETERAVRKAERRVERHADRDARREARRALRELRRRHKDLTPEERARETAELQRGWSYVPWPVRLLVQLGLTVAQVAVALSMRLLVPLLLTLLSVIFGRGLRRAAVAVREAHGPANAEIEWAKRVVGGPAEPRAETAVRVAASAVPGDAPKVRVAPAGRTNEEDEALHEAAVHEAAEMEDWERRLAEESNRDRK